MSLKKKIGIAAGALLIAGGLFTGAAFANTAPETTAKPAGIEATTKASTLSDGAKEVLQQLHDLRKSVMEKFQADSKALVDKAVTDGKITQDEAEKLLKFGGPGGHGGKGMGFGGGKGGPRGGKGGGAVHGHFQSKLDAAVKDGTITQEQANKLLEQFGPKAKANQ